MTTTGVSNSSSASYAMDLAQTSQLRRSLNNFGQAIESGNLNSAESIFAAVMKSHPDYAKPASNSTAQTPGPAEDPINKDFQTMAAALDAKSPDSAKAAWAQLKSDLGKTGVVINDGKAATSKLLSDTKASQNQKLLSNLLGVSSGDTTIVGTLLGSGSNSSKGVSDPFSSVISNWLTYRSGGKTSIPTASTTDSTLDTKV